MSQNPSDVEMSWQQPEQMKPKKGWFGRNWVWFVPTIILLPILCCGGGALMLWYAIGEFKDMPPFKDSLTAAQQNAQVQQALGSNIDSLGIIEAAQSGKEFKVDANDSGGTAQINLRIPIKGSAGSGTLVVECTTSNDGTTWVYTVQQVEIDSTGQVIDLLGASGTPVAPTPDTGDTEVPSTDADTGAPS